MSSLDPLFAPASIAVVGASASEEKLGAQLLRTLDAFPGPVVPVNPRECEIGGRPAFPRLADAPGPVDLVLLAIPAPAVPDALLECADAGVRAAVVCASGFAETGSEGARLQDELYVLARARGVRLLGPNTSGFVSPARSLYASFVPSVSELRPGPVAVVAQSGGVMHALAFMLAEEGTGISLGVGLGNAVDVGFADVLDHLAQDAGTAAVALAIEGAADGRALAEAVARTTERKPVVVLHAGRADVAELARSHTGALAGSRRLALGALTQAGAVVVEDTTELVDAVRALAAVRLAPAADPGIGVVTAQAGPGLLIVDALRAARVAVPELAPPTVARLDRLLAPGTYRRNPVDTGRPTDAFGEVLAAVAADPAVAALAVYALVEPAAVDLAAAVPAAGRAAVAGTGGTPGEVAALAARLEAAGVPLYRSPERTADAARALAADARGRHRRRERAANAVPAREPVGPGPLDEDAAKALLEQIGIPTPRRRVCSSRAEARVAFAELGSSVVVKVLDAGIEHKSDAGGVHLGVDSPEKLERALDALAALGDRSLVEEQVPDGVDLIVGGTRDASFGPAVLVGLGGVVAEALEDVSLRLAPLSRPDALEMVGELRAQELLDGHRGRPAVDRERLADVLLAVSHLLLARPEIRELDVNPLRASDRGLVALDALVVSGEA